MIFEFASICSMLVKISFGAVIDSPELVKTLYGKFGAATVIEQVEILFKVTVHVPLPRSAPLASNPKTV